MEEVDLDYKSWSRGPCQSLGLLMHRSPNCLVNDGFGLKATLELILNNVIISQMLFIR